MGDIQVVNRDNFVTGKRYKLLSADGSQLLSASDVKSTYACKPLRFQGYSMSFAPPELESSNQVNDTGFIFSGSPGKYRMHCSKYGNNMMFFLGVGSPREWVVWDTDVPIDGEWEVVDIEWLGQDDEGKFKIRGHADQYVKWAVSGFSSSGVDDATVFMLHEDKVASVPKSGKVNRHTFVADKQYEIMSVDGTRLLRASGKRSNAVHRARIIKAKRRKVKVRGYSMKFEPLEPEPLNKSRSAFMFSGSPGRYRLLCSKHGNNVLFFMGMKAPKEWEVLDVEWVGKDKDGAFRIRSHEGQYVKWAVSKFISSTVDDATEFILREV